MDSDYAELRAAFPGESGHFWGVRERLGRTNSATGVRGPNQQPNTWPAASVGDHVAFSAHKKIFGIAEVVHRFEDASLARSLWGPPSDGRTFKYMLGLQDIYSVQVPVGGLLKAIGDSGDKDYVQEFRVLDDVKSAIAAEYLFIDEPLWAGAERWIDDSGPTDLPVTVQRRLEQRRLAEHVMAEARGTCALCHREFEDSFLVTAHIKQRSHCTNEERRDLAHVAMAACKLGCDAIYEAGLVGVTDGGRIVGSPLLSRTTTLTDYFSTYLENKRCTKWNGRTSGYFEWHMEAKFRRIVRIA